MSLRPAIALAAVLLVSHAHAEITTYTDRDAWFEAVSPGGSVPITTIGFFEFDPGTHITDQYASKGVNFSGVNFTIGPGCTIYPEDCWALQAGIGGVTVDFDAPRFALGMDHPASAIMELFYDGKSVGTAAFGASGPGNFSAIISDQPFDSVILSDGMPPSFIDDLHFITIPAPAAGFVFIGVFLCRPRGRRRAASVITRRCATGATTFALVSLGAILFSTNSAYADITTYTDRDAWFGDVSAAGAAITSIGFDELGGLAIVTDQYQHLGVTFTDGNDSTRGEDFIVFPRDGWGLDGNEVIHIAFDAPRHAIAVDYPGAIQFDLYRGGTLVGSAMFFEPGFDSFAGLTSTTLFDSAVLTDPIIAGASIDNLHFATIPAPAGLLILLPFTFFRPRIRRRGAPP